MQLKLVEIRSIYTGLSLLKGKSLPAVQSFKLSKFIAEIEPLYKKTEDLKLELAQKYGTPDESNKENYLIHDLEAFSKEWNTLLDHEENVSEFKLKVSDLGSVELPIDFFLSTEKIIEE